MGVYNHRLTEKKWRLYEYRCENSGIDPKNQVGSFLLKQPIYIDDCDALMDILVQTIGDIFLRRKRMQGFHAVWFPSISQNPSLSKKFLESWSLIPNPTIWNIYREVLKRIGFEKGETPKCAKDEKAFLTFVTDVFIQLFSQKIIYHADHIVSFCPTCRIPMADEDIRWEGVSCEVYRICLPRTHFENSPFEIYVSRPELLFGWVALASNAADRNHLPLDEQMISIPIVDKQIPIVANDPILRDHSGKLIPICPGHGYRDYRFARKQGLPVISVIDDEGRMMDPVPEKYRGMDRFHCREQVILDLEKRRHIVHKETANRRIPFCPSCAAILEFKISGQWFLQVKPAIDALKDYVEKRNIPIVPESKRKNWIQKSIQTREWSISRQTSQGFLLPAYLCCSCGFVWAVKKKPYVCSQCGSSSIQSNQDRLDPRFIASLFPYFNLEGRERSVHPPFFSPYSIRINSIGSSSLWKDRFWVVGFWLHGLIPLKELVFLGKIQIGLDKKTATTEESLYTYRKILKKYGSDTIRLAIASQMAPAKDVVVSLQSLRLGRNFIHKLWHAARFFALHKRGDEKKVIDVREINDMDRWILHELNHVSENANGWMEKWELGKSLNCIMTFFCRRFCRIYIESAKFKINVLSTREVVLYCLRQSLLLLYPFIPWVTEEIHRTFLNEAGFLLSEKYPDFHAEMMFSDSFGQIESLRKVIHRFRSILHRPEIRKNRLIRIYLIPSSKENETTFRNLQAFFEYFIGQRQVAIVSDNLIPPKGFRMETLYGDFWVSFDHEEDRLRIIRHLDQERKRIEKDISTLQQIVDDRSRKDSSRGINKSLFRRLLLEKLKKRSKLNKELNELS